MSYKTDLGKKKRIRTAEDGTSFPLLLKSAGLGAGIALLCALLLLLLSALVCYLSEDPHKLMLPLGLAALYLSSLIGGIVAVRHHGSSALFCGALCGLLLMIVFWCFSLFFKGSSFSFPIALLLRMLTALSSVLGSFLGLKRSGKRPHRKK